MHLTDEELVAEALAEAQAGVAEGGMPFGSVLVVDGTIVARGHNRQVQDDRFMAHAETVCFERHFATATGPLAPGAVLVATEAPCPMCAGAAVVAGVSRVVVGEDVHYRGALPLLRESGIETTVLDHQGCIDLVADFRRRHAELWGRYSAG